MPMRTFSFWASWASSATTWYIYILYTILRFINEKMFNIFFIKIIIPGWTKNKWVKMGFPHLRAKIWENHATISCFLFLLFASFSSIATISLFFLIITTDFFTSRLPFKWYVCFPTGFRRVFTRFVLLLFLLLTYCARRIY